MPASYAKQMAEKALTMNFGASERFCDGERKAVVTLAGGDMQSDLKRLITWQSEGMAKNFKEIDDSITRLHSWILREVVGNDVFPREIPLEAKASLAQMAHHLGQIKSILAQHSELRAVLTYRLMRIKAPYTADNFSEQDFYLCRALGYFSLPEGVRSEYETCVG